MATPHSDTAPADPPRITARQVEFWATAHPVRAGGQAADLDVELTDEILALTVPEILALDGPREAEQFLPELVHHRDFIDGEDYEIEIAPVSIITCWLDAVYRNHYELGAAAGHTLERWPGTFDELLAAIWRVQHDFDGGSSDAIEVIDLMIRFWDERWSSPYIDLAERVWSLLYSDPGEDDTLELEHANRRRVIVGVLLPTWTGSLRELRDTAQALIES